VKEFGIELIGDVKSNMSSEKKVSPKKKNTQTYKWIKDIYGRIDVLQEKLKLIEDFLGGTESMKKVLEDCEKQKTQT